MTLLETRELVKIYSGRTVVNKINISVAQRSIVGLLGRNGAGKTTTFRMVIGMIVPDAGSVIFEGTDITKLPMYKRARLGMGYLSQEPSVFQRLSVRDNLRAILETMSITTAERQKSRPPHREVRTDRGGQQPCEIPLRWRAKKARNRTRNGHKPFTHTAGRTFQRS